MDCPRCESTLERYTNGDREAVSCPACGFADVPADHRYRLPAGESWTRALERFYEE